MIVIVDRPLGGTPRMSSPISAITRERGLANTHELEGGVHPFW
jgi:hypothetical protein